MKIIYMTMKKKAVKSNNTPKQMFWKNKNANQIAAYVKQVLDDNAIIDRNNKT